MANFQRLKNHPTSTSRAHVISGLFNPYKKRNEKRQVVVSQGLRAKLLAAASYLTDTYESGIGFASLRNSWHERKCAYFPKRQNIPLKMC